LSDPLTQWRGLNVGAEAFVAAMLQAGAQPVCVLDAAGVIRLASPAAVATLGYEDAGELVGRHSHEALHYSRADGSACPAARCLTQLSPTAGELVTSELDWFRRRDGSMFPVAYVSVPLDMPAGRGAVVAFTDLEDPLRADRVLREREADLADEQASLRRVAALAAQGASSGEVFAAVAAEVAQVMHLPLVAVGRYDDDGATMRVIGCWGDRRHPFQAGTLWPLDGPSMAAEVLRTGRPARVEGYAELPGTLAAGARESGVRVGAGAPIIVDGRVWGVMATGSSDAQLPDRVEDRLADFTALVATAITNGQAREDLGRLANEQAALRRVATLVAEGATPADMFAAVAREIGLVLQLPVITMFRYEPDGTVTGIGAIGDHPFQPGTNWPLDGPSMTAVVRRTGQPTRVEGYADIPGAIGEASRRAGFQAAVAAPIVVDGEVWGAVCAGAADPRVLVPLDAESRLSQFTALVATAISNTQAREDLSRLADEQAALRRVATLVAEGATPADVFAAVAREIARVLKLPLVGMYRYEPDGTVTGVGAMGQHPFQPDTNWPLDGPSMTAVVRRTGRPTRVEDYTEVPGTLGEAAVRAGFVSGVGAPIVVDGELWGSVVACSDQPEPLPPDAESHLSQFTALVATAISNTQAREDLSHLADEQAALRRLATLVAQGADAPVVFDAVCEETSRVVGASSVNLAHFTADGSNLTMAGCSVRDVHVPAGTLLPLDGDSVNAVVRDTAAPARFESYEGASGALAHLLRRLGIRSEVGAPVVVEGRVWGVLVAGSDGPEPLPASTERRLANFAELIATAVANAAARSELMASRVRIVEAADQQRRQVVRDLHDGAQSRLIHAVIALERVPEDVRPLIEEGLTHARSAIGELRDLAHGIHPEILSHNGLAAAVQALAGRTPLPVEVEIPAERFPTAIESAAYFVAAEALTNVAKYARATTARITATRPPSALRLVVEDDGAGGATPVPGGGLTGLGDRLAALDGHLTIDSPAGGGTRISAEIPLPAAA
jgi:PAS domain S-box-containing protein